MAEFKKIIQSLGLLIAIFIACCLFFAVSALPSMGNQPNPNSSPKGTTDTPIFIPTTPVVATPIITPTSAPDIIIHTWKNQHPKCVQGEIKWVEITGLELSGGVPPYRIIVSQDNKLLFDEIINPVNDISPYILNFNKSFYVVTGVKANVIIKSSAPESKPELITDLYFEVKDKRCATPDGN